MSDPPPNPLIVLLFAVGLIVLAAIWYIVAHW